MDCSTSIVVHLLRGIGAVALIVASFFITPIYPIIIIPMQIGAILLLRGCPMCWLLGLIEKLAKKRSLKHANERK